MTKLFTKELVKVYGGRRVVDKVNVELKEGEVVGLLGPNGAGKTTTFNMVLGFVRPDEGQVFMDSQEITCLPMHKRAKLGIAYLPQETSIFRKLTVEENIMAILQTLPMSRKERRQRRDELLEEMGIQHLAKNKAYTLSGGERRRVEIARCLVLSPIFILLDEPFTGVDPKTVEELQEIIKNMKDQGLGILITDHNVRETLEITDRSYLIFSGKIQLSGKAQDLISNATARELYFGEKFYMRPKEENNITSSPKSGN